jgi:Uma2 family endonuclease
MVQELVPKLLTFEEYLATIPDIPDGDRYELIDGFLTVTSPNGDHEDVIGFLKLELGLAIRQVNPRWFIPNSCVLKPYGERVRGYQPDIAILQRDALSNEPFWKKYSTIIHAESIALVIEVASSNWRDDYFLKLGDYEAMGIPEYWIADFKGIASQRFLGPGREPAISVYNLLDGEYQLANQFRGSDALISPALGCLQLTAEQVLTANQNIINSGN